MQIAVEILVWLPGLRYSCVIGFLPVQLAVADFRIFSYRVSSAPSLASLASHRRISDRQIAFVLETLVLEQWLPPLPPFVLVLLVLFVSVAPLLFF